MIKKPAETEVEIAPLISERWSPRVFDPEFIIDEVSVKSILEGSQMGTIVLWRSAMEVYYFSKKRCIAVGKCFELLISG
jgi:hypothetical protein